MKLERSVCKGCGAAIIWVTSPNGSPMPLDAKAPTYARADSETDRVVRSNALVTHFATCRDADKFSKGKR